ncbi:MAG: SufS family cysteine desulfurase [bacterium]
MKKEDFPLLSSDIIYLDSAATTQKPHIVIDAVNDFYNKLNVNTNRGSYKLALETTKIVSDTRKKVANFINAKSENEIIFTKNATEASNLLAYSYGLNNLSDNDGVVLSIMEHHANIVPWQFVTKMRNSKISYMYLNDYQISKEEILRKITDNTKVVCITHISNALGVVNDIEFIIKTAHDNGAIVIVDASQSIAHKKIDVTKLDADFLFFSGHKMLAPLGIGVLYGKEELLNKMPPFIMGGDMIEYVYEDYSTFKNLPNKFEAGTQNVEGIYGLGKAIDYINEIGFDFIHENETLLMNYALSELEKLSFIDVYLPSNNYSSIISFNVKNVHSHDVSSILDAKGICIRVGNHCAQPLLRSLDINATCRVSFYIYNTKEDVDKLIDALKCVEKIFKRNIEEI